MNNRSPTQIDAQAVLSERIEKRLVRVAVVGLGAVGLPLCEALHAGGLCVTGIDTDEARIRSLELGECYLDHFGTQRMTELMRTGRFKVSACFEALVGVDVIVVCVPTPLGENGEPDLACVTEVASECGRRLQRGQLIILESTTYPGTTRDVFAPAISSALAPGSEFALDVDYFIAYSPEREDPGSRSHSAATTPRIVGGLGPAATMVAADFYRTSVVEVVEVQSPEVAEAAKMLENVFRCVNVALVNEMKVSLDAMGIDIWEVIHAAATKPFGFMPFEPGLGIGGHCIPVDPVYFIWKAAMVGQHPHLISTACAINMQMPTIVAAKVVEVLGDSQVSVDQASILVIGVAYKPDLADTRESPALELIRDLSCRGAEVEYFDPHVERLDPRAHEGLEMKSIEFSPIAIRRYDAVVIATAHQAVDYSTIARCASVIVDTRNVILRAGLSPKGRLVKA